MTWGRVLGAGAIALVLGALVWLYGGARYAAGKLDERVAWRGAQVAGERAKLDAYKAGVADQQTAGLAYAEMLAKRPAQIERFTERNTEYAATPLGAAQCLGADRVLWLDQARADLFPWTVPAPAAGGGEALRAGPAAPQP